MGDEKKLRFLRLSQVEDDVQLKKTAIYAKIKTGDFPAPYSLGKRAKRWEFGEIQAWCEARIEAGRQNRRTSKSQADAAELQKSDTQHSPVTPANRSARAPP